VSSSCRTWLHVCKFVLTHAHFHYACCLGRWYIPNCLYIRPGRYYSCCSRLWSHCCCCRVKTARALFLQLLDVAAVPVLMLQSKAHSGAAVYLRCRVLLIWQTDECIAAELLILIRLAVAVAATVAVAGAAAAVAACMTGGRDQEAGTTSNTPDCQQLHRATGTLYDLPKHGTHHNCSQTHIQVTNARCKHATQSPAACSVLGCCVKDASGHVS
jgi:hypothetical protein